MPRTIYHLISGDDRRRVDDKGYEAASLASEGFIHCSNGDQVARVASLFFASLRELLVLHIDVGRLTSPVRDEDIGTGERFPHVYGPINAEAISMVTALARWPDGQWVFGESPADQSML